MPPQTLYKTVVHNLLMKNVIVLLIVLISTSCEFGHKTTEEKVVSVKLEKTKLELGADIFKSDCQVCHKRKSYINTSKMRSVMDSEGINYVALFLTKQDSLIANGDAYSNALKSEYNHKTPNSHNFRYTKEELINLFIYIRQ